METTQSLLGMQARFEAAQGAHEGEIVGETRSTLRVLTGAGEKVLLKSRYSIIARGERLSVARQRPEDRMSGARS